MIIVDAHEDVASGVLGAGRDVRRSALETRRLEEGSQVARQEGLCMLGLPEWLSGRVAIVFTTIFASPAREGSPCLSPQSYTSAEEAHVLGTAQLDYYRRLVEESDQITLIGTQADLEDVLAGWANGEGQVGFVLLMEGADPIRQPQEVEWWFDRGVRFVGPAWMYGSRYAGGNGAPGRLTAAGRELLAGMEEVGLGLDVSHLSDESFYEALDVFGGVVIASHSNPRVRVPGPRQLSDQMIRRLVARDGVIGVVLYNGFLRPGWSMGDDKGLVTLDDDIVGAIDHVCQLAGDAAHVGLGSDFDGGFGAESVPAGLDTVADLGMIGAALSRRGYSDGDVAAILAHNWLHVLKGTLPG